MLKTLRVLAVFSGVCMIATAQAQQRYEVDGKCAYIDAYGKPQWCQDNVRAGFPSDDNYGRTNSAIQRAAIPRIVPLLPGGNSAIAPGTYEAKVFNTWPATWTIYGVDEKGMPYGRNQSFRSETELMRGGFHPPPGRLGTHWEDGTHLSPGGTKYVGVTARFTSGIVYYNIHQCGRDICAKYCNEELPYDDRNNVPRVCTQDVIFHRKG